MHWGKFTKYRFTIEWGIAIGLVLMIAGFLYLIIAFLDWKAAGFGPLSYQKSLRTVILAVTGIGLGIQVLAYGFALAILGVKYDSKRY